MPQLVSLPSGEGLRVGLMCLSRQRSSSMSCNDLPCAVLIYPYIGKKELSAPVLVVYSCFLRSPCINHSGITVLSDLNINPSEFIAVNKFFGCFQPLVFSYLHP